MADTSCIYISEPVHCEFSVLAKQRRVSSKSLAEVMCEFTLEFARAIGPEIKGQEFLERLSLLLDLVSSVYLASISQNPKDRLL